MGFDGLEERFSEIVSMVAMRYGWDKTREDREDYEQDCWIALLQEQTKIESLKETEAVKYAYTVCKNAVLKQVTNRPKEVSLNDDDVKEEINESPEFLAVDDSIDLEKIIQKLDELPNPYKDVLKRRFGVHRNQETLETISKRYDVSYETIRRWEAKGLKMLRKEMGI